MSDAEKPEFDISDLHTTAHFPGVSNVRQLAFLAAFCVHGVVKKAAKVAGIGRRTHYFWLQSCKEYKAAFHQTRLQICDHIEEGLVARLINGWKEPVFFKDEVVGYKRKFDHAAALRYLERVNPDVFGERQADSGVSELEPVSVKETRAAMIQTVIGEQKPESDVSDDSDSE